ncbi:MAG: SAM-dependent DNA methyltransferase [Burkholderiales bacterium]|jgi:type I restriction enzyme M protein|nr:SAM-dependent DNA methyltransferase [Burkholderiales bacterium]
MNIDTHRQLANDIWSICNLLRGPYKRNEYRKVILPLTVLRRFDCLLAPTKAQALQTFNQYKGKPESIIRSVMQSATGYPFYNLSRLELAPSQQGRHSLLDDPGNLAPNLNSYINGYSPNIHDIFDHFRFGEQITKMAEKNLLFQVIQKFATFDLSFSGLSADQAAMQMGYVFEELIRIGAEQSNEEAGEHFTPREVIKLMVNLLLAPEQDLRRSHVVKTIYDPACGTGGMLSVAEKYIRDLNHEAKPLLYGQDWNDEAWAVCRSDMLIKGEDADNIALGDTFTKDAHARDEQGQKRSFDYMLANPPFGVEWKQQQRYIEHERDSLGYQGRFGAGTPRINDGALLFLQHMIDKMRPASEGGSRIGIVFNGSPLFTGDAGSGESEIRRWIIENDWLEVVVALPEQLFYNTGISTYIWILTNHKEPQRKGKVQLIDARNHWVPMEKSLGNKRRRMGDPSDKPKDPDYLGDITRLHGLFQEGSSRWVLFDQDGKVVSVSNIAPTGDLPGTATAGQAWKQLVVSQVFDNEDFGYHKITVERPLRLNFHATPERLARLTGMAGSEKRQQQIYDLLAEFAKRHPEPMNDRKRFLDCLKPLDRELDVRLSISELKAVVNALGERDESAEICRNRDGEAEADPELRDTENVPLKESIQAYFEREVLPHVPNAWIDHSKTKIGYEIPLNRHFYRYEPPRELAVIEAEIKALEADIVRLLGEVTA